jgi:hypothetical protein
MNEFSGIQTARGPYLYCPRCRGWYDKLVAKGLTIYFCEKCAAEVAKIRGIEGP